MSPDPQKDGAWTYAPTRAAGPVVVHVTATGITARSFLGEHFRRLARKGLRVVLACSDDADARAIASETGIEHVPVNIMRKLSPLSDLLALLRMRRVLRRLRPVIVHAHMTKAGLIGMIGAWMVRVPVRVYHNHGLAMFAYGGLKGMLLRMSEKVANRLATHVLFCSRSTREAAIAAGVAPAGKSRVLGDGTICGVDVERFSPAAGGESRAKQRREWGAGMDDLVVGFVGRIEPHKGIEELITAWRRVRSEAGAGARLILVGPTEDAATGDLVSGAEREGIGVSGVGWCSDMVAAYGAMDMLVLPSWREGFPYSVLEAQAMGLAVVATRVTGNVDAVEDGRTGLLVPVRDPQSLAVAVERLAGSEDLRKSLGTAARRRVVALFSQQHVLDQMMDFYDQILATIRR